jgi:hypothetical protein
MKKTLLALVAIFMVFGASAQLKRTDSLKNSLALDNKDTVAWVYSGTLNIGLNQGFLHNWAAGGEVASATVNGLFSGMLTRMYHRSIWSNNLDMNYALFYAYSNHFQPRKMDDRIDFTSKYGYHIDTSSNFFLTGLFNFKSQFTKGYDYEAPNWDSFSTSDFLSPAYFTLAAGMEYRRGTNLSLFLSPAAARITTASTYYTNRAPEGAFGIENGKTMRFELGAYFSGRYLVNITPSLTYKTRLDLYSNYLAKDFQDSTGKVVKKDSPGNIDILFDNLFSYKLGKFLSLTLGATFIYDNDLPYDNLQKDAITGLEVQKDEPGNALGWWQIKQTFAIGFQYKF